MNIFRVDRDLPLAWAFMPQILDRVGKFCEKYDPETAPQEIIELVRAWFTVGDKRLGLWITHAEGLITGHLLATPEPLGTEYWRYVLVRQAEVDNRQDLRKESKIIFDAVKAWTKSLGLDTLVQVTHRNPDAMTRSFGWKPYKTIMKMSVKEN